MTDPSPESVSGRVLEAVARTTGDDPVALPPMWDVVDPDRLDALFAPAPGGGDRRSELRVQFTYAGLDVVVRGDGEVDVRRPTADGDRSPHR